MKILLSGGTGYVGSFLVPELLAEGHDVTLVIRNTPTSCRKCKIVKYGGLHSLAEYCNDWKPEAVIHLAANTSKASDFTTLEKLLEANIKFPLHLLAATQASGASHFINITTFSTESEPNLYSPQTLYAATKKAFEDLLVYYARSEGLKVTNLAFYDVYGPDQPHERFLPALVKATTNGESFSMTKGQQEICLLNVKDAVSAILYCLKMDSPEEVAYPRSFCVYGPEVFKLADLPGLVARYLKKPPTKVSFEKPYRKHEIMKFSPQWPLISGWMPQVSLHEGLQVMVKEASNAH